MSRRGVKAYDRAAVEHRARPTHEEALMPEARFRQPPHVPGAKRDHRGRDARLAPRPRRPAARAAERPHQRGLRRLRHAGPAAAHARAAEPGPADRRGLRPQPQERGLRRVVPQRAARQRAHVPRRPHLGRGGAGLPLRARGGPRARGPALRLGGRSGLPRLRRLPRDAGEGEGPRRRLHHDARPSPRHGRARGHEGREARDRPQAARQRPARGAARDPDGARDRAPPPTCSARPGSSRRRSSPSGSRPARSARCARCTTGPRGPSGRRA